MRNHNGNGKNGMPKPEPIWLVMGMLTWAIATAMAPTVRRRFFDALEDITEHQEALGRIVTFERKALGKRELDREMRVAIVFVRRLLDAIRATGA